MLTPLQKERYSRHLGKISEGEQESLLSKHVVQVGIGGLGSPLAYYLVAMGIGTLTLIEYDTVSISNLNRQILYSIPDLGSLKTDVAKIKLNELNPDVKINIINAKLTNKNYADYISDADYLVDASDSAQTKFLVNDIGIKMNIPFTIAGVREFEGQLMSVIPHKTACYRCVFGKSDIEGALDNYSDPIGIFGFTAGTLGAMQAAEVIKGLLRKEGRLLNTLIMVDLEQMQFLQVKLSKNPKCFC
ncbi:MAG: HesA/MoeB/ThiF family protein [Candidatus Lokiarchaeota archaeon]|nr:HesA/MoeB/ThiF family protein [Candidatus Lokiarchaeota archaeon]